MKNNELLTLILAELRNRNEIPKPVGLVPPAYVKTFLRNPIECQESLYSHVATRGNMVHQCNKKIEHDLSHSANVNGTVINWYTN